MTCIENNLLFRQSVVLTQPRSSTINSRNAVHLHTSQIVSQNLHNG